MAMMPTVADRPRSPSPLRSGGASPATRRRANSFAVFADQSTGHLHRTSDLSAVPNYAFRQPSRPPSPHLMPASAPASRPSSPRPPPLENSPDTNSPDTTPDSPHAFTPVAGGVSTDAGAAADATPMRHESHAKHISDLSLDEAVVPTVPHFDRADFQHAQEDNSLRAKIEEVLRNQQNSKEDLAKELSQIVSDNMQLKVTLESLQGDNKQGIESLLQAENDRLKVALEKLKKEMVSTSQTKDEVTRALNALVNEKERITKKLNRLKKKNSALVEENASLLTTCEEGARELKQTKKASARDAKSIHKENDMLIQKTAELEQRLKENEPLLASSREENSSLQAECVKLHQKAEEVEQLQKKCESLQKTANTLAHDKESLSLQLEDCGKELCQIQREHGDKIAELEGRIAQAVERSLQLAQLQAENDALKHTIAQTERHIATIGRATSADGTTAIKLPSVATPTRPPSAGAASPKLPLSPPTPLRAVATVGRLFTSSKTELKERLTEEEWQQRAQHAEVVGSKMVLEVARLQEDYNDQREEAEHLTREVAKMRGEAQQITEAATREKQQLTERIEVLTTQLQEKEKAAQKQKEGVASLEFTIEALRKEKVVLSLSLKKQADLEAKIHALTEQNEALTNKCKDNDHSLQVLKQHNDSLREELSSLRQEKRSMALSSEASSQGLTQLQSELSALSRKQRALEQTNADLTHQRDEKAKESEKLKKDNTVLQSSVSSYKNEWDSATKAVEELKREVQLQLQGNTSLRTQMQALQQEAEKLRHNAQEREHSMQNLRDANTVLKESNDKLTAEKAEQLQQLQDKEQNLQQLRQQIGSLQEDTARLEEEKAALVLRVQDREQWWQQDRDAAKVQGEQLASRLREEEQRREQQDGAEQQQLRAENEALRKEKDCLAPLAKQLEEVLAKLSAAQAEKTAFGQQAEQLAREVEALKQHITDLSQQLQDAVAKAKETEIAQSEELHTLREANAALADAAKAQQEYQSRQSEQHEQERQNRAEEERRLREENAALTAAMAKLEEEQQRQKGELEHSEKKLSEQNAALVEAARNQEEERQRWQAEEQQQAECERRRLEEEQRNTEQERRRLADEKDKAEKKIVADAEEKKVMQSNVDRLEAERLRLTHQLEELSKVQVENTTLRLKLGQAEDDRRHLADSKEVEVKRLQGDNIALKAAIAKLDSEKAMLCGFKDKENAELQRSQSQLGASLEKQQCESEARLQELLRLQRENAELHTGADRLALERDTWARRFDTLLSELAQLRAALGLGCAATTSQQQWAELAGRGHMQTEHESLRARLGMLEHENATLRSSVTTVTTSPPLKHQSEEYVRLQQDMSELRAAVSRLATPPAQYVQQLPSPVGPPQLSLSLPLRTPLHTPPQSPVSPSRGGNRSSSDDDWEQQTQCEQPYGELSFRRRRIGSLKELAAEYSRAREQLLCFMHDSWLRLLDNDDGDGGGDSDGLACQFVAKLCAECARAAAAQHSRLQSQLGAAYCERGGDLAFEPPAAAVLARLAGAGGACWWGPHHAAVCGALRPGTATQSDAMRLAARILWLLWHVCVFHPPLLATFPRLGTPFNSNTHDPYPQGATTGFVSLVLMPGVSRRGSASTSVSSGEVVVRPLIRLWRSPPSATTPLLRP
eukprot:TRINITY_DN4820_c0_g1_i3.p1 TRINITY_DN4820_c0_g1~~TRINITY_DN4820_c0_g1_i3.p1  ORF type:complete len:1867 (+),score=597.73 TRINITY_DN4820_c0_g1_i3:674-5602(+)